VRGDVGFNIGANPSEDQFALLGLSDTLSGTLIYEKHGISARVAYNWRDKFLSAVNRQDSRNPEFTAPFGQLDATISYEITPQIAITLEGINLTEESVRTYARDEKELWFAQELDRRFLLGARFKF
jgi:outer membrane receptor protein involved in Fe transport